MIKKSIVVLAVCLLAIAGSAWAQTIHVLDTGDPNDRVCNPKSYTDLGSGIVKDNVTGLEWVQDGNLIASRDPSFDNDGTAGDGKVTWQHALDYIDLLNADEYLGYGDWRMPTIEELANLVDAGRYNPAIDPLFSGTAASYYWSSTTLAYSTDNAWIVDFYGGVVNYLKFGKGGCNYVRAVRGGTSGSVDNFVSNGDGSVTDTNTDLMWQQCNDGQTWNGNECAGSAAYRYWDQAVAYVQVLKDTHYLGYDDWRLPTRNELRSLLDYSRYNPATTFPDTGAGSRYWTSTTAASDPGSAWNVAFWDGYSGYSYNSKGSTRENVRAVRGGQCRASGDWCIDDSDCSGGYGCVDGTCRDMDAPPAIGNGPFVAAGWWPLLSASAASPTYLKKNVGLLWSFSDDFASCQGDCTHTAEYQALGSGSEWTPLSVSSDAAEGYAYVDLPIDQLQNATTYAFRFTITDCAGQSVQSETYYFRVARTDAPPVIGDGPFVAAGSWPVLSLYPTNTPVLNKNTFLLVTFSDDFASCGGACTHRAWYAPRGGSAWTGLTVETSWEQGYAYAYAWVELPVSELENGTYCFVYEVTDCAGQRAYTPHYFFKVNKP